MAEFNSSDITFLEIEQNETHIKLKKEIFTTINKSENINSENALEQKHSTPPHVLAASLMGINAPLVGVFYSSPSPDSAPFVKIGSKVKKGDVLGLIEAMKMINEIKSTCDGTVKNILIKNEQIVEFGQTLMEIEE